LFILGGAGGENEGKKKFVAAVREAREKSQKRERK
jgi:hypothetical protein